MQYRYIINEPPARVLKNRLKEAIISGDGVSVTAKALGSFSLKVINENIVFVPDNSDIRSDTEEELVLHPLSIYTAVSEDEFAGRSVVSAIKGMVEDRDESFLLTVSNEVNGFDELPTELVINPNSDEFTD